VITTASRLPTLLACLAVIAGLLSGCGGEKSAAPYQEVEDQLGFTRTGIQERQARVENVIRDCMKTQGFDYVPVDPFAQQAALTGKARLSDEEFLKQFGYGISTLVGRGSAQSDPNDRIRKSLGPADRRAYDRALGGENPGLTFAEAVDSGDFTDLGGCTMKATGVVFGGPQVLSALQEKLDELDERIAQDQRMVRAVEKWSTCMTDAGFRYTQPDDVDTDVAKRFRAIVGSGVPPGATAVPAGVSYDRAALAALQREEVKVANTDLACEKRHITPVESKVRPQYEADFRQQNRRLLARVRPLGR
jgi:hypothetical protein